MAKVTRKSIISTIISNDDIKNILATATGVSIDEISVVLNKWDNALTKASKTNASNKNDETIINEIVPFVLAASEPVTAKMVNDQFIHAERTNKASAMLRRAIEMGLISRDRVRKNANYVYAEPNYDWDSYIAAYDKMVAEKAASRIAKARANRS